MYVGITCLSHLWRLCEVYKPLLAPEASSLHHVCESPTSLSKVLADEAMCRFPKGTYHQIHVLPPSELFPLLFYPMESSFRLKSWPRRGYILRSEKDKKLDPCRLAVLFSAHFQITSPTTDVLFLPSFKNETSRFPWPFRTCFFPKPAYACWMTFSSPSLDTK